MGDSDLEQLVLRLTADITGLEASLNTAAQETKRAADAMQTTLNSVQGGFNQVKGAALALAGAVGITLSVEAFKSFIKGSMDSIVSMANMSDRLGIATEKLSGLKAAAEENGVSFESLTSGITRMERAIGNAATKTEAAQKGFHELGINAKDLAAMRPDESFQKIADAINGLGSQAEKAKVAVEIFGRGGLSMMNLFAQSVTTIEDAQKKMEKFGDAPNRIDSAKIQLLEKSMHDVDHAVEGVGKQLAIMLAGPLKGAVDAFNQWVDEMGGMQQVVLPLFNFMLTVTGGLMDEWQMLVRVFRGLEVVWDTIKIGFNVLGAAIAFGIAYMVDDFKKSWALISAVAGVTWAALKVGWYECKDVVASVVSWVIQKTGDMMTFLGDALAAAGVKGSDMFRTAGYSCYNAVSTLATNSAKDLAQAKTQAVKAAGDVAQAWDEMRDVTGKNAMTDKFLSNAEADAKDLDQTLLDIRKAAEEPWNSTWLKGWVQNAQLTIQPLAEKIAAVAGGGAGGEGGESNANKIKELQGKLWLEKQQAQLNQERLQENENYQQEIADAKDVFAKEQTDQASQDAILENLKSEHEVRLANIHMTNEEKQLKFDKMTWDEKASMVSTQLKGIGQLMNTHSRAMFEVGKAAALAGAICDVAAGAAKALNNPYPYNLLCMASVIAAGAVQISAIASTNFGGGGGVSGAGGAAAVPPPTAQIAANSTQIPSLNVIVPNDVIMDSSGVRKLMALINQQLQDGTRLATA